MNNKTARPFSYETYTAKEESNEVSNFLITFWQFEIMTSAT